jgi:hypothetical protein
LTLESRLADAQKLTEVLRDKPRHDLVRDMSAAFTAEDFDGLEVIMQRAKEMETHSPDYAKAVAEAVRRGQPSGFNGLPPHNYAVAGFFQQGQVSAFTVQSASRALNTGPIQEGHAMEYDMQPSFGQPATGIQEAQRRTLNEQSASRQSNSGLAQQGQGSSDHHQPSFGHSNGGPFDFAQPYGFPGITPVLQAQHSDFPRAVGPSVLPGAPGVPEISGVLQPLSGNVPARAENSERLRESPFKVGSKAS